MSCWQSFSALQFSPISHSSRALFFAMIYDVRQHTCFMSPMFNAIDMYFVWRPQNTQFYLIIHLTLTHLPSLVLMLCCRCFRISRFFINLHFKKKRTAKTAPSGAEHKSIIIKSLWLSESCFILVQVRKIYISCDYCRCLLWRTQHAELIFNLFEISLRSSNYLIKLFWLSWKKEWIECERGLM